ncbi:LLM class flavin-dependent oxidoreductase [Rhodococcus sp. NPDC003382]|uniref:LLM class flavin-dependent oxidoreductase n=1 Tax=unclassified Rhodococcus (in: high G+C Gram-positive bacteria) TaxID=192944 RepID=UPI0018CE4059|nr:MULTISPECIES: LLM class flavin-dependent oxidoreductase [unclassified Rhodococcus (in: high G+C Gram-positive bacteria)]MBH0119027.1 LLM class flavin-dependent oxidoreductase [Rhodococcus sp. CX]MCK8673380.1 LLM class flavin-dependent oxidoreductase [Rhodococcus sp. HM1]
MGIKTFWYLTQADGDYPWSPGGLYPVDGQRQIELAKTIDNGGFDGALVATWPNDPFISATWAAAHTTRMKFLVAIYANMTPARLLAEKALTFDAFSGGRLMINSVNGRENILTKYDMNVEHDRRYELGEKYWADFRRIYAEGTESNFPNTPLRIDAPSEDHSVPLWGTGDSPAGLQNSGKVLDAYLVMLRETAFVESKFTAARESAAAEGREFTDFGALSGVIVRPTQAEALDRFRSLFEKAGIDRITDVLDKAVRRRTGGKQDLKTFTARDAQRQGWVDTINAGRLPEPKDLYLGDGLYAGITAWSPLDIFATGSSAVYYAGTPDEITGHVRALHDRTGLTTLILAGWPLIDEAKNVAEHLIPRFREL